MYNYYSWMHQISFLGRCEVPIPVANGEFIVSANQTETLSLTCNEGFRIVGPASANCTHDSLWQPTLQNTSRCANSTEAPELTSINYTVIVNFAIILINFP